MILIHQPLTVSTFGEYMAGVGGLLVEGVGEV